MNQGMENVAVSQDFFNIFHVVLLNSISIFFILDQIEKSSGSKKLRILSTPIQMVSVRIFHPAKGKISFIRGYN